MASNATLDSEEDNETEFPHVFASVLDDPASDANRDGRVSLLEIFNGCNAGVSQVGAGNVAAFVQACP